MTEVFKITAHIRDQGLAVLLIEQNAAAALAIADRGYVLEVGRVVLLGTGAELACDGRTQRVYLNLDYCTIRMSSRRGQKRLCRHMLLMDSYSVFCALRHKSVPPSVVCGQAKEKHK